MRKVIWNKLAKKDYFNNIDFLLNSWNEKVAQEFIDEVYEIEFMLKKEKQIFKIPKYVFFPFPIFFLGF